MSQFINKNRQKTAKPAKFMQEYYVFNPLPALTNEDFVNILKAMQLTFHEEAWERLSEETRKHFIVHSRNGASTRYKTPTTK